jgi:hypothetical protein
MVRHCKEENTSGLTEAFHCFKSSLLCDDLKQFFNGEETLTIG